MEKLSYRPEIDGLRAIAVLSVIVFHAGIHQIPGGFIGVDIFYVISGYLITKIIIVSLEDGKFTFGNFYVRRIKRIFPAAIFMVMVTVIFAAVILTPDKYVELSKSAIYSILCLANIWFMVNSGYFDQEATISPLIHMWSLSVEEQFYLIYPFFIVAIYRYWSICGVKALVLFIIFISLFSSVYFSDKLPNFSFYMFPTRAWELSLGGILTLIPPIRYSNKLLSNFLSVMGIGAIVYGLMAITHINYHPGFLTLIPTIGTGLIIYSSCCKGNFVKFALTLPPILLIGKISYSAYLWHWPITVFYRTYINERSFERHEAFFLIVASLIAGYLSWKYIEERYRYKSYSHRKTFSYAIITASLAIGISGVVLSHQGFPNRISLESSAVADENIMWNWNCTEKIKLYSELDDIFCVIGEHWDATSLKGIVWGDSHSQHWAPILHQEALEIGASLVIAPLKCPPYLNSEYIKEHYPEFPGFTENCTVRNKYTLDLINSNDEIYIIIMAAAWSGHARMLYTYEESANKSNSSIFDKSSEIGARLSEHALRKLLLNINKKNVLLLGDIPRPNKTLNECAFAEMTKILRDKCDDSLYKRLPYKAVFEWHKNSNLVLKKIANDFENVNVILPTDALCDISGCQTYVNNELIYKDSNHLRRNLTIETIRILSKKLGLNDYFLSIQGEERR